MYATKYQQLVELVAALAPDVEKANKDQKAAKVRIRQALQQVKRHAQEFRQVLTQPTTPSDQA